MPQNFKLRGNVWWFRKRVQGKDQEISLETDNLGVAKARRDRLLQELREQGGARWGENRRHTFNDAAERFGKEHFKTLKDTSRVRYIVSISNLLKIFDNVPLCEISSVKLGEFEQRRRCEGVTNSTIRRDLACLSVIFSTAEEWEWAAKNPVKPYLRGRAKRGLKEGDPRTRYLDHQEETALLQAASPKAAEAIIFAIDTGLRKKEKLSLLWSRVDLRARAPRAHMAAAFGDGPHRGPEKRLRVHHGRRARLFDQEPYPLGGPSESLPKGWNCRAC